WFGKGLSQRSVDKVPHRAERTVFEKAFEGGLIEVEAHVPLQVRAHIRQGRRPDHKHLPGSTELTPELLYVWTYLSQGKTPIDFSIRHAGSEPTPLRIDVHQHLPTPWGVLAPATPPTLRPIELPYQLLDASGGVLHEGKLLANTPLSKYDRLKWNRYDYPISEPASFFFSAHPGVARLRILPTSFPAWVTVYNRPGDLAKTASVPEDYFRFNRTEVAQRTWFLHRA